MAFKFNFIASIPHWAALKTGTERRRILWLLLSKFYGDEEIKEFTKKKVFNLAEAVKITFKVYQKI